MAVYVYWIEHVILFTIYIYIDLCMYVCVYRRIKNRIHTPVLNYVFLPMYLYFQYSVFFFSIHKHGSNLQNVYAGMLPHLRIYCILYYTPSSELFPKNNIIPHHYPYSLLYVCMWLGPITKLSKFQISGRRRIHCK